MRNKIKGLYTDAGRLHAQAQAILAEYDGKDMPQEKANEVDALLDAVEAKTTEAKRLERMVTSEETLTSPANEKSFFSGVEGKAPKSDEYKVALTKFMLGQNMSDVELKNLQAGIAPAGGYLIQDTFMSELLVKQQSMVTMRRLARVLPPVPSGSVIVPSEENALTDATWTPELLTGAEDAVEPFGRRMLTPHALAKRIKISNTLLRTQGFDVEAWVRDRMARAFSLPEEDAFINGDGVAKPLGILSTVGLPVYTTAASNTVTADDIINWIYSLPASYASGATILCNRAFIRKVRAMKDGGGNYIWQPGLTAGSPNTILDTPYALSDEYDDGLDASDVWEDSAKIAVVGNFNYYWIVDALGMSLQRLVELYAATNEVGFIGRKETDGMAVLQEAFIALVVKA